MTKSRFDFVIPLIIVVIILFIGTLLAAQGIGFKLETLKQACLEDTTIIDKIFCDQNVYTALGAGTYNIPAGVIVTDVVTT